MQFSDINSVYEIGKKKNQEDYLWPTPGLSTINDKCFIVCDGVGGSENGEVASKVVAEYVGKEMRKVKTEDITLERVSTLLYAAQQELIRYANNNKLNMDMATTFSMCVMAGSKALLVWCGDSRIYHIRNGKTLYKTQDHSLVGMLLRNGDITEEEAAVHPRKNIILRAVKADESPIDAEGYWINDLDENDFIMLCTDGLLENVKERDLYELLKPESDPTQIIKCIKIKCENRTRDNYSMYLLKVGVKESANKKSYSSNQYLYLLFVLLSGIVLAIFLSIKAKMINTKKTTPPRSGTVQTEKKSQ